MHKLTLFSNLCKDYVVMKGLLELDLLFSGQISSSHAGGREGGPVQAAIFLLSQNAVDSVTPIKLLLARGNVSERELALAMLRLTSELFILTCMLPWLSRLQLFLHCLTGKGCRTSLINWEKLCRIYQ